MILESDFNNEDGLKNEDNIKSQYDAQNKENLKIKTTPKIYDPKNEDEPKKKEDLKNEDARREVEGYPILSLCASYFRYIWKNFPIDMNEFLFEIYSTIRSQEWGGGLLL